MGMIEFKNDKGQVLKLDESLTIEQLVARGIDVKLSPREQPREPGHFYHDPVETAEQKYQNRPLCHCVKPQNIKNTAVCKKCDGVISWLAQT